MEFKQYEHAARLIDALGRQVGGWLRSERSTAGRGREPKPLHQPGPDVQAPQ